VIITLSEDEHPFVPLTDRVYVNVPEVIGVNTGLEIFGLLKPVTGVHVKDRTSPGRAVAEP
jgi:hypothetical protein